MDLRNLFEITAWFNLKKTRDNTEELVKQGRENERIRRGYNALKDCPYCGAKLPKVNVAICMHCRKELAWVERTPCKPGTERQVRKQLKKSDAIRVQRLRAEKQRELERAEEKLKEMEAFWGHVFKLALVIVGVFLFEWIFLKFTRIIGLVGGPDFPIIPILATLGYLYGLMYSKLAAYCFLGFGIFGGIFLYIISWL